MTFIFTVPSLQLRWQTSDLHTTEKQNKKKYWTLQSKMTLAECFVPSRNIQILKKIHYNTTLLDNFLFPILRGVGPLFRT